jgi:hypothetical protein
MRQRCACVKEGCVLRRCICVREMRDDLRRDKDALVGCLFPASIFLFWFFFFLFSLFLAYSMLVFSYFLDW